RGGPGRRQALQEWSVIRRLGDVGAKGDGWRAGDRDPVWVAVVAGLDLDGIAVDRRRRRDDRFADFGVPHAALGSSELRPEQLAQDRPGDAALDRSEEHTSELQSRVD